MAVKHKVGFIIHPVNERYFWDSFDAFYNPLGAFIRPILKKFSFSTIKNFYSHSGSHKFFDIKNILVDANRSLDIVGMMCPMFPDQMVASQGKAIAEIAHCLRILESEGVEVVTLGGFTSIISKGGDELIGKFNKIKITTGNTLTAATCVDSISKILKIINRPEEECVLAIVGATGDIGVACARYYSKRVKSLVLCARTINSSNLIVKELQSEGAKNLQFERTPSIAVKDADIVILATSAFGLILDITDFKPGAIVCDISIPHNVPTDSLRQDILVFDGGRVKLPFYKEISDLRWKSLFPMNNIYGCLGESICLALTNSLEHCSLGKGKIDVHAMSRMISLAKSINVECSDIYSENTICLESNLRKNLTRI